MTPASNRTMKVFWRYLLRVGVKNRCYFYLAVWNGNELHEKRVSVPCACSMCNVCTHTVWKTGEHGGKWLQKSTACLHIIETTSLRPLCQYLDKSARRHLSPSSLSHLRCLAVPLPSNVWLYRAQQQIGEIGHQQQLLNNSMTLFSPTIWGYHVSNIVLCKLKCRQQRCR